MRHAVALPGAMLNAWRLKMGGLRLAIIDKDERYMESLASYIVSNYGLSFSPYCFTTPESFIESSKRGKYMYDIVLITPDLYEKNALEGLSKSLVFLEKEAIYPKREVPSIFKYKHCDSIIADLIEIQNGLGNRDIFLCGALPDTKVIGVYSPVGGSGKSTTAAGLSIQCARRGMKVLYLNLESVSCTASFFNSGEGINFSRVMLSIKCSGGTTTRSIVNPSADSEINGLSYYLPPESTFEWEELSVEEYAFLLDYLKNSRVYNIVIIDLDCSVSKKNLCILQKCDIVFLLTVRGNIATKKMNILYKEILRLDRTHGFEICTKIVPIENKYIDRDDNCPVHEAMPGFKVSARLPYSREIEVSEGCEVYYNEKNGFVRAISKLLVDYIIESSQQIVSRREAAGAGEAVP
jgi:cellulose biosynthesis protein BcsQ